MHAIGGSVRLTLAMRTMSVMSILVVHWTITMPTMVTDVCLTVFDEMSKHKPKTEYLQGVINLAHMGEAMVDVDNVHTLNTIKLSSRYFYYGILQQSIRV